MHRRPLYAFLCRLQIQKLGSVIIFFPLIFGTSPLVRTRPRRVTLEQIGKAMYTLAQSYFFTRTSATGGPVDAVWRNSPRGG